MQEFQKIKDIAVSNNIVTGDGFLLSDSLPMSTQQTAIFRLKLEDASSFGFIFGWVGIGSHYRLHVDPIHRILSLYQVRDGIPLYLHHICCELHPSMTLEVQSEVSCISIKINGFCVMNLLATPPQQARWGFTPLRGPFKPPHVEVIFMAPAAYKWICLGDGFSNNRWRNRHFISWPELTFGRTNGYLNACVAAANTHRVQSIAKTFGATLGGSKIIVATGTDDLLEGESCADFEERLRKLMDMLKLQGANQVFLATLPPRASDRVNCLYWSERIRHVAADTGSTIMDFHDWLAPHVECAMIRGEYPGAAGQAILATQVAKTLEIELPVGAPKTMEPTPPPGGRLAFIPRKLGRRLEPWLLDYPGLIR